MAYLLAPRPIGRHLRGLWVAMDSMARALGSVKRHPWVEDRVDRGGVGAGDVHLTHRLSQRVVVLAPNMGFDGATGDVHLRDHVAF